MPLLLNIPSAPRRPVRLNPPEEILLKRPVGLKLELLIFPLIVPAAFTVPDLVFVRPPVTVPVVEKVALFVTLPLIVPSFFNVPHRQH